jgi:hypothetical protein
MDQPQMGRFVSVTWEGGPPVAVCTYVAQSGSLLHLRLPATATTVPDLGATVWCYSSVGEWHGEVMDVTDATMALHLPTWVGRLHARRSRRVTVNHEVGLHLDKVHASARLRDLSRGGAAVVAEKWLALHLGEEYRFDLPGGTAKARVVTSRPTRHPLLVRIGMQWTEVSPGAAQWIGQQLAATSASLRQRPRPDA